MKKIIIICSTVLIAVICFLGIDKYKKEVDRKVLNIAKEIKEFQEQGIKDLKAYL